MAFSADRSPNTEINTVLGDSGEVTETVDDDNWVDAGDGETEAVTSPQELPLSRQQPVLKSPQTLAMVESAFLASMVSIIWLINYYFPIGPLLRILFPIPLALVYLFQKSRALRSFGYFPFCWEKISGSTSWDRSPICLTGYFYSSIFWPSQTCY